MTTEDNTEINVVITEELAVAGERRDCERCPIALAINEHLVEGAIAHVEKKALAIFTADSTTGPVNLPMPAKRFIWDFDHHLPIDFPVEFKLALPSSLLKTAAPLMETV